MIVGCSRCGRTYSIDENHIPPNGTTLFCSACKNVIMVHRISPTETESAPAPISQESPPAPKFPEPPRLTPEPVIPPQLSQSLPDSFFSTPQPFKIVTPPSTTPAPAQEAPLIVQEQTLAPTAQISAAEKKQPLPINEPFFPGTGDNNPFDNLPPTPRNVPLPLANNAPKPQPPKRPSPSDSAQALKKKEQLMAVPMIGLSAITPDTFQNICPACNMPSEEKKAVMWIYKSISGYYVKSIFVFIIFFYLLIKEIQRPDYGIFAILICAYLFGTATANSIFRQKIEIPFHKACFKKSRKGTTSIQIFKAGPDKYIFSKIYSQDYKSQFVRRNFLKLFIYQGRDLLFHKKIANYIAVIPILLMLMPIFYFSNVVPFMEGFKRGYNRAQNESNTTESKESLSEVSASSAPEVKQNIEPNQMEPSSRKEIEIKEDQSPEQLKYETIVNNLESCTFSEEEIMKVRTAAIANVACPNLMLDERIAKCSSQVVAPFKSLQVAEADRECKKHMLSCFNAFREVLVGMKELCKHSPNAAETLLKDSIRNDISSKGQIIEDEIKFIDSCEANMVENL